MSNYLTVCSICLGPNNKRIVKEHPEVYEEVFSSVREFNKKTRQFEKITKKVMILKNFDDEPHETETIENSNFQYLEDGFIVEELFPICSNVLNTTMTPHYGHYSCIRDLVISKDSDYNITKCPQCREYILDDVYDTIKEGPNYQEKRQKISEKNKNIKKFDDFNEQRSIHYQYDGGSMLAKDETVKIIYNTKESCANYETFKNELFNKVSDLYIKKLKHVFDDENGFESFQSSFKGDFFKNIPIGYKLHDMVKEEHADVAAFLTLSNIVIDYPIADPKLLEYLKNVKVRQDCIGLSIMQSMNYTFTFCLNVITKNLLDGTLEESIKSNETKKLLGYCIGVDPRPFLFSNANFARIIMNELFNVEHLKSGIVCSVPIPLYGITKDHALFLYNSGFVFTRFAVSKKHGRKIDDYSVSIPRLLFWEQRSYETSIKAIANNIVNGSGIDKEVADAIATISYQNKDNNGSVRFEIGRYGDMDISYKQLEIFDNQRKAKITRQQRRIEENELQIFQDIEGLCISELLFGHSSTNIPSSQMFFNILAKSVDNCNMEDYLLYKKYALYSGVLLHISLTRPDCNPWLKRLKNCENKIFYYVVLIDLMMNVMITGGRKNVATELSARYADILINKVLGKISNDLDLNQFKNLVNVMDLKGYVTFAERNSDDTVLNSVKVVKYVYEKVLYYGDNIAIEASLNIEEYQRCLHTIATNPDGIVNSVPLVPLYINNMILKCFVEDEEFDAKTKVFLQLIQLILNYGLTGKGIKKIKPFIKNNDELLHTMMPKLNIEVFADLIIKGRQDFDNVQRLAMTYSIREAVKNK